MHFRVTIKFLEDLTVKLFYFDPSKLNLNLLISNSRLLEDIEDLKKKLAEEKKQRNDRHVVHRNEVGILRAENEDLKKRVRVSLEF